MGKVFFHKVDVIPNLKQVMAVKNLIGDLFNNENYLLKRVDYIFCSDDYLLKINRDFLGHDTYTDIITFLLSDVNDPVVGEIYISTERIKENAKSFNTAYQNELIRVIIHGTLHLCGWVDDNKKKKQAMHNRENHYLKLLNVPREANS